MSEINANLPALDAPATIVAMILAGLEAAKEKTEVEEKDEAADDDARPTTKEVAR